MRIAAAGRNSPTLAIEARPWRVAGASVTGPGHAARGVPNDDAASAAVMGPWLIAAACDGAGGAACGGAGAAMVAEHLVAGLAEDARAGRLGPGLRRALVRKLEDARERVEREAAAAERPVRDFATTAMVAVARNGRAVMLHLGDGCALAFAADRRPVAALFDAAQEYANETDFLTADGWRARLRVAACRGVEAIMLLTDGASAFALKGGAPVPGFVHPVLAHLAARAPDRGAEALRRLLDRPDASGSNPDDKTLLWAGRTRGGSTPDAGPGAVSEPGL